MPRRPRRTWTVASARCAIFFVHAGRLIRCSLDANCDKSTAWPLTALLLPTTAYPPTSRIVGARLLMQISAHENICRTSRVTLYVDTVRARKVRSPASSVPDSPEHVCAPSPSPCKHTASNPPLSYGFMRSIQA